MWELTILTDKRMSVIEKTFLPPVNITLFWHHLADQLSGTFRHREKGKVVWKLIFSLLAPQHQPPRLVPSHHDPNQPNLQSDFNQQHQHQVTSGKAPRWHMPGKTPQGGQEAQGPGLRWWTLWSPPWADQTSVLRWTPSWSWTRVSFFLKSGDILTFCYLLQGRQRQL